METINTGMVGTIKPIVRLIDMYGNNTEARTKLAERLLSTNPFNPNIDFDITTKGNNNKVLDSLLFSIGIKMTTEVSEPKEDEYDDLYTMTDEQLKEFVDHKATAEINSQGDLDDQLVAMEAAGSSDMPED